jgi:hypothetical protein
MLAQLTAAAEVSTHSDISLLVVHAFQIEREMGSAGFFILYFAAGIFG